MPKQCYRCKRILNISEFGVRKTHGGHPCKECAALYTRQRNKRNREKLFQILGGARCVNPECLVPGGCADIRALQFEHKNGYGFEDKKKFKSFYLMIVYYINHPQEAKEKLQVYCANCNWIKRSLNNEVCKNYRYR